MPIKKFEDIIAWQKAHALTLKTYKLTKTYPKEELFSLVNQTRRCAVSIPSNIVEGFRRNGINDRLHFYNIAQASLEELRYQIILAKDLEYISHQDYNSIVVMIEESSKTLNGWIKSQRGRGE